MRERPSHLHDSDNGSIHLIVSVQEDSLICSYILFLLYIYTHVYRVLMSYTKKTMQIQILFRDDGGGSCPGMSQQAEVYSLTFIHTLGKEHPRTVSGSSCAYLGLVTCSYLGSVTCSYLGSVTCSYLGSVTCSYLGPVTCSYLGPVTCSYLGPVTCSYLGSVTCSYLVGRADNARSHA